MFEWIAQHIKKRAERKKKHTYMMRHGMDLRCPHCDTWASDAFIPHKLRSFVHPIAVRSDCGQCGKASYWVCEAGFWFRAEEFGITIGSAKGGE